MSTTFAKAGKHIDDRIADFKSKVREVVDGVDDAIKSSDRIGYERALKDAADYATNHGAPGMATGIINIKYRAPQ